MLSTGLFDTSLCVKFYGFVYPIFLFKIVGLSHVRFSPLNDWSIRIWQAVSKRVKNMILCSKILLIFFSLCPLQSIDTEGECYNILLDNKNICWNWHLSGFCTFSTFRMLTKYKVKRLKVIKCVTSFSTLMTSLTCLMSHVDILTIYSPSITLNLRNIFPIYIQQNFSTIKQTLQTKKLPSWI